MGIPFYYRHIIQRDQRNLLCEVAGCKRLFLDFNSIIHTCAGSVISKFREDVQLEEAIFKEVLDHTMMLTTVCTPSELLYIAIDGVAPRSKIQQQRKRRYLSAYRSEIVNKFKDNNNIKYVKWDSNAITPGTKFMKSLYEFLSTKFQEIESQLNYKIVLSGSHEPGEGEQKIFDYMHDNMQGGTDVIYGLDADLIMLSLCSKSSSSIYLMREGQNFFNSMTEFKFLNIPALKGAVSKYLYNSTDVSYMYDYVFICFFLGNDFLPNVSCLKIKTGAIDVLVDIYRCIFESIQSHLILHSSDDFQINMEFLVAFLEKLAEKEDALMLESTKTFYESNVQTKTTITNKLEKFTYELDNYPSINKFPLVINPATDSTWKVSYYHHLFGNTNIRDYCQNYIEGLFWIVDYYFNRKTNMSWFYKYNYAPCLSDIFKHLMSMTNQKIELEDKDVINEDMQLLIVLPPSSKNLLNHKLLPIVEDIKLGCVHYYPVSFCLTSYLKSHLWECHPVIPVVDAKLIKAAYEKLTTK